MKQVGSPYYPPRARWHSPLLHLWDAARRRTCLDQIHLPDGISAPAFIGSLLIPGVAFMVRKEKLIGQAILLGYGLLGIVFIVWLGFPVANVAFGLMLSAHVTSISFLLNPWFVEARFGFRIVFGLALLLVVGGGIYAPLRNQFQAKHLMPLRIHQKVVVVQTFSSPQSVKCGDWIAYSLRESSVPGIRVGEGLGLGPVLAMAGDCVRFTPEGFEVNGVRRPLRPHMPAVGELVVPENHWFLWPDLAITGHGNVGEATLTSAMLPLATVWHKQFIGKPFQRWFWRRQILL